MTLLGVGAGQAVWAANTWPTGASAGAQSGTGASADAVSGVRLALQRGAEVAVELLGRPDGFLKHPEVAIPLPSGLREAAQLLRYTGQQQKVDALVLAMNRAAEAAVPHARSLLIGAVRTLSVGDAWRIVQGGETSVTRYFSEKTRRPLADRFLPIVTQATERVALADKFNAVAGRAHALRLLRKEDANLQQYVTRKALDGLYWVIGEEEKKLRRDPLASGSELLARIFGGR